MRLRVKLQEVARRSNCYSASRTTNPLAPLPAVNCWVASRDWPQPERFPRFLDKMGALMAKDYDWSPEIRQLKMPVMLAFAGHDAVSTGTSRSSLPYWVVD